MQVDVAAVRVNCQFDQSSAAIARTGHAGSAKGWRETSVIDCLVGRLLRDELEALNIDPHSQWRAIFCYVGLQQGGRIVVISKLISSRSRAVVKRFAAAVVAILGLGALSVDASAADGGPFANLAGGWIGNGTVTYASGTKERLRCKVKYSQTNEDSISQALRCASDSYKFEINAYYKENAGSLTGHWQEFTLQISGSITGTATEGRIAGDLHGPGFTAAVLVSTNGNEQTVTISAADKDIRQVTVAVRKSSN